MRARTTYTVLALAGAALLTGCPSAVDNPTWVDDIQPILAANCVRCHGSPPIDGAPASFRLDIYGDTVLPDGRTIRGAGTVAEFIALRAGDGSMPPRFALPDHQRETLHNWFATRDDVTLLPTKGGPRPDNAVPTMTLLTPLDQSRVQESVVFDYEIRDEDFDIVFGTIAVDDGNGARQVASGLHAGRGGAVWDLTTFEAGTYQVSATLDDSNGMHTVELGSFDVVHTGNVSPSLRIDAPRLYALQSDRDPPLVVTVAVSDLDALDTHTATITAVRGAETHPVGDADIPIHPDNGALCPNDPLPVDPVDCDPVTWDTTPATITAGAGWRLQIAVSDGTTTREFWSAPFAVTHGAVTTRYTGAVEDILANTCGAPCHDTDIYDANFAFGQYDGDFTAVYPMRGRIYQRVIVEGSMPPKSSMLLEDDTPVELSDADRALLRDFLEQGAEQ